jgi:hypothetical protein
LAKTHCADVLSVLLTKTIAAPEKEGKSTKEVLEAIK